MGISHNDKVVCLGTSLGTNLAAIGMELGHVIILDMSNGMLIQVW